MKKDKIWRRLNDALYAKLGVAIERKKIDDWRLRGFVVGLSDEWALLHIVDGNFLRMDGYCAVRVCDITRISDDKGITPRFLELNHEGPVPQPDILLLDLPGLLSSAAAIHPLLHIETEDKYPNECYIGRVVKIGKRNLTLRFIKTDATWRKTPNRYALADITKVQFGDAYNAALWRIAQEETPSP